jgi:hypothetical protein
MYKITRVEEIYKTTLRNLPLTINKYINEELKEDEIIVDIEYFKNNNEVFPVTPTTAYLHIGKLIKE